jgi:uncharacterized protein YukE
MAQGVFVKPSEIKSFQGKLQRLADDIKDLHDMLERQLATLHDVWDDPKYQEFLDILHGDKQRIVEISETFHEEVTGDLQRKYGDAIGVTEVH